jgi:hypothetical protein
MTDRKAEKRRVKRKPSVGQEAPNNPLESFDWETANRVARELIRDHTAWFKEMAKR